MKKTIFSLSLLAFAASFDAAKAGEDSAKSLSTPVAEKELSLFDKIWSLPTLYKNDDNAFLQEFKIIGRYHGQYHRVDATQGVNDGWENRRIRIGAQAKLFDFIKLVGQINIDDDFNPFYGSIDEAFADIDLGNGTLTIGKFKPEFTHEYKTSSKRIATFERSLLVNQLIPDKSSGISYAGKAGDFRYSLGLYSGDGDAEFGGFNENVFSLVTVGKDLGFADWEFGYLYNGEEGQSNTADYRHSFSSALVFGGDGPLKVATDLIYANGFEDDAYGLVILPTYDITEKLQVVGRYQYAHGENDSLRAQSRYERQAPNITDGGFGEDYHAFYAGLNYFIYGDKLKLMTGVEYSDLNDDSGDGGDFEGWSVFTGVRMYF